jgi:hypothetical protein
MSSASVTPASRSNHSQILFSEKVLHLVEGINAENAIEMTYGDGEKITPKNTVKALNLGAALDLIKSRSMQKTGEKTTQKRPFLTNFETTTGSLPNSTLLWSLPKMVAAPFANVARLAKARPVNFGSTTATLNSVFAVFSASGAILGSAISKTIPSFFNLQSTT